MLCFLLFSLFVRALTTGPTFASSFGKAPQRSHSVPSYWKPCRSLHGGGRGVWLQTGGPRIPTSCFYHLLASGNKNTLGGSRNVRVLAKRSLEPPLSRRAQGHLCEANFVMEAVQRKKRREGGGCEIFSTWFFTQQASSCAEAVNSSAPGRAPLGGQGRKICSAARGRSLIKQNLSFFNAFMSL